MPKFSLNEMVLYVSLSGRSIIKIIEKRGDHLCYEVLFKEYKGDWVAVTQAGWEYNVHSFFPGLKKISEEEQLNFLLKYS